MSAADDIYQWLIAPIEGRMLHAVTRLVRDPDEAADALQNALAQVWRDLSRIIVHPNPQAYIMKVCINAAYDALRRRARRRWREAPLDEGATVAAGGEFIAELMDREARGRLLAAIAALPRQQAQALLLRVMEEQSFAAVADALGCSEATARSHVSKARERLREILVRSNQPCPAPMGAQPSPARDGKDGRFGSKRHEPLPQPASPARTEEC